MQVCCRSFASTKEELLALCPIDGRYKSSVGSLASYFSESALIKHRVQVEVAWFRSLLQHPQITLNPQPLGPAELKVLDEIVTNFSMEDALRVKAIEAVTNHDMKAVEYFIKEKINHLPALKALGEYIHFTCTSEDINNLAYGLMVQNSIGSELVPTFDRMLQSMVKLALSTADAAMMSHTHGQPATPTTMGKEIANYIFRLEECMKELRKFRAAGKFNGAVGNYNAHRVTCPEVDWIGVSKQFVESLGLEWRPYSTQIEQHDVLAEFFNTMERMNTILVGFCRDAWMYVSYGYFKLKVVKGEVGSSTMPHKINPINFENAEGTLGLANALLGHFVAKLPISRMQRDLSDSTVLRSVGVALGYSIAGYSSILNGISRLDVNREMMEKELESHYELLAEAVQTVMRRYKKEAPYEKLKEFTRGKQVTRADYLKFVGNLDLPPEEKAKLEALRPALYTGYAKELARDITKYI